MRARGACRQGQLRLPADRGKRPLRRPTRTTSPAAPVPRTCSPPSLTTTMTSRVACSGTPLNPTHALWRELVEELGFPFLKTDLLLANPDRISDLEAWPMLVHAPQQVPEITAHLALMHHGEISLVSRSHDVQERRRQSRRMPCRWGGHGLSGPIHQHFAIAAVIPLYKRARPTSRRPCSARCRRRGPP